MRRLWRTALLMAFAIGVLASTAAGSGSATGDPAAIAFYKQAQAAYRSVPAVRTTERGVFWYEGTGSGGFRYDLYRPPTASGEKPATLSELWLLRGGRVTKVVWEANAAGLGTIVIIEDSSGMWAKLAHGPAGCYYKQPNFRRVGKPFIGVVGTFSPLQQGSSVDTVTSTYPWGTSGTATEVDKIATATKQFVFSRTEVSGSSPLTDTESYHTLAKAPALVLTPEPHC